MGDLSGGRVPDALSGSIACPIAEHLASATNVFVTIEGHDSGNTSYGVEIEGKRWFVKHADQPEAIAALENAVAFHGAVKHPAIIPVVGSLSTPHGLATVSPWTEGQVLNDPFLPGGLPYHDPASPLARFRALPAEDVLLALDTIFMAHEAVARAGYVAVDFYDGCVLYDFERHETRLCDLDFYRPGPFTLDRERQWGSTRYMAPEEFERGSLIDERTTVFNLGRAAFIFLGPSPRGETDRAGWRGTDELYEVAVRATAPSAERRFTTVAAFAAAWRMAPR